MEHLDTLTWDQLMILIKGCLLLTFAAIVFTNRDLWLPIVRSLMSRAAGSARRAGGMDPVYIPVSQYGMESGGMDGAPDIDAPPPFKRDISDPEWIAWLAVARGKDRKYRFSANKIHDLIGGDRNAVLARVKELRTGAPPAQFRQDDGSTAPASYPMTKSS